ncbi:DUF3100 domain-containing protein [candidate division KSB3 bacterium]|uniref:DUF3100 domain-containing protein n=1 Tax=candidate division KSB3 bacterium TaxID=2044937 RepID=A0A9D5JUQ5_9BACT|nr:DUF3100 domain-containing protein [candidate division KSB3 bacterium]MBD3324262.1 DUF3100 domain-containing protein [candidate division KSB3 bacterium]
MHLKLHLTVLIIVIICELIGIHKFPIGPGSFVLLPMLYAVVIGILITPDVLGKTIPVLKQIISMKECKLATSLLGISLLPLGVKYGTLVGPNMPKIIQAGPAFILQELGNLGTICLALPIALLLGLKREAVGGTVSVCREVTLGIVSEYYGINSPEGRGVLGTYLTGTLVGTIFFGLLGGLSPITGLHPYALAMACGIGSASMMTASSSSLATAVPEMKDTILAYAATSNLLTGVTGMYMVLIIGLPGVNFLYRKLEPILGRNSNQA